MITAPPAPALQKMVINFARSKIIYSLPAPLPILNAIDYATSNHKFIKKNKSNMLIHPKKIAKHLPGFAVSDIMNSDIMHHHIDAQVHGMAHEIATHGIQAIDFIMSLH